MLKDFGEDKARGELEDTRRVLCLTKCAVWQGKGGVSKDEMTSKRKTCENEEGRESQVTEWKE